MPKPRRFSVEILESRALLATFTVTNISDDGPGSLRQAIVDAQADGDDTIDFAIPGAGVHTIAPLSALPFVPDGTTIDGYSQPGTSENTNVAGDNAVLLIEINGTSVTDRAIGLDLGDGCTVRGLVINRFADSAIRSYVTSSSLLEILGGHETISGNFLGTDPTGRISLPNGRGVDVLGTSGNRIGGATPADRNLLSGNGTAGVAIESANLFFYPGIAADNVVAGNLIGVDATGAKPLGNAMFGVEVNGALRTTIGGSDPGSGNVIGGNGRDGILIGVALTARTQFSFGENTLLRGNFIGTDASGALDLGNLNYGIVDGGHSTTIGGASAGERNVIRFNGALAISPPATEQQAAENDLSGNRMQVPDLAVSFSPIAGHPALGRPFTITATVVNRGLGPADDGAIDFTWTPYLTVLSVSTGQVVAPGASELAIPLGRVEVGAQITITLTAYALAQYDVTARVSGGVIELNPNDNIAILGGDIVQGTAASGIDLIASGRSVGGVRLGFSAPLDTGSATNPANYRLTSAGRDGRFGTRDDTNLTPDSVTYDSGSNTVTINLRRPLPAQGTPLRVVAGGPGTPGLVDGFGNLVYGDTGVGASVSRTAELGARLSYRDRDGDMVTLQLARGGLLQLDLAPEGGALSLALLSPIRGKSLLSGTVRRVRGGDGRADLGTIIGLGGLDAPGLRLTAPHFAANVPLPAPKRRAKA